MDPAEHLTIVTMMQVRGYDVISLDRKIRNIAYAMIE